MGQKVTFRYYQKNLAQHYRKVIRKQSELVDKALKSIVNEIADKIEIVTSNWKNPPKIVYSTRFQGYTVDVLGDIFKFVDQGVKSHTITTYGKKAMKFQWPGERKQYVGKTGADRPANFGAPLAYGFYRKPTRERYFKKVRHPGIKARRWTLYLQKRYKAEATRRVRAALKQGYESVGL